MLRHATLNAVLSVREGAGAIQVGIDGDTWWHATFAGLHDMAQVETRFRRRLPT